MKLALVGQRFGRLTVLSAAGARLNGKSRSRYTYWLCRCDCGGDVTVRGVNLRYGTTSSCGCFRKDRLIETRTTHGEGGQGWSRRSREYMVWSLMLQRCSNPKATGFAYYGGRGIRVCDRWRSFVAFLADVGRAPTAKHTIDRLDSNGDYEPGNCRWASRMEQVLNRSTTRWVTLDGETMPASHWADKLGVSRKTFLGRLNRGLSGVALTKKTRGRS